MSELPCASLSGAAERIRQILVSAEALSEDIHRQASEEAERYLAKRKEEADALLAASKQKADALLEARRERFEQVLLTLRNEGREIERRMAELTVALERALEGGPATPPAPEAEAAAPEAEAPAPEAEAAPEPVPAVADEAEEPLPVPVSIADSAHERQRALIRATQLAVQGADRASVRETLEREFTLEDPAAIVEEILGSAD